MAFVVAFWRFSFRCRPISKPQINLRMFIASVCTLRSWPKYRSYGSKSDLRNFIFKRPHLIFLNEWRAIIGDDFIIVAKVAQLFTRNMHQTAGLVSVCGRWLMLRHGVVDLIEFYRWHHNPGARAFSVCAPRLWNRTPNSIRTAASLESQITPENAPFSIALSALSFLRSLLGF